MSSKIQIKKILTKINKEYLLYITIFVICVSYSLFRFLYIDVEGSIHINDGYLLYTNLMKTLFQSGSLEWYDTWFSKYTHKNRVLFPFIVSIFSLLTFIPPLISGMIINALSYLLTFYYLTKIAKLRSKENQVKKIFLLFFSSSIVMTNFVRFATDGMLILFVTMSFYYYNKWEKEHKIINLIFSSISQLLAILTRECAILLSFVFILYSIKKKKYRILIYIIIGIFVILAAFINIRGISLLFIILNNIFLFAIAYDLSKGIINIPIIFKYTISKFNCYYIFHLFSTMIYSFFIFSFFSIYEIIYKENRKKYNLDKLLILSYLIFIIFVYNGRILGRFWLPVFIFLINPAIEGMQLISTNIKQKNLESYAKYNRLILKFARSEKRILYFSISVNYIIAIGRLIFSILLHIM